MNTLNKSELRAFLRDRRKSIPAPLRAKKSRAILDRLFSHPAYLASKTPALTCSAGTEVDTHPLLRERLSKNLPVLLPRVADSERIVFHRVELSLDRLVLSDRGILEPTPDPTTEVSPTEMDLLVVPGVGFDPEGHRLGQGGGYFDRFLSHLPASVPKLGLAFNCQVVPEIPCDPHDRPVDEILTEQTSYRKVTCQWITRSVEETHQLAQRVAELIKPPVAIRLTGELGAGKTEWVRGFARAMGWKGRVRSPSFSLENLYQLPSVMLYHLDGYRLVHPSNLDRDRFEEMLEDPEGVVLIEWPERFGERIPLFSPELHLERLKNEARRITWTSYETRHALPEKTE